LFTEIRMAKKEEKSKKKDKKTGRTKKNS